MDHAEAAAVLTGREESVRRRRVREVKGESEEKRVSEERVRRKRGREETVSRKKIQNARKFRQVAKVALPKRRVPSLLAG
jgi:hypothetical protein